MVMASTTTSSVEVKVKSATESQSSIFLLRLGSQCRDLLLSPWTHYHQGKYSPLLIMLFGTLHPRLVTPLAVQVMVTVVDRLIPSSDDGEEDREKPWTPTKDVNSCLSVMR